MSDLPDALQTDNTLLWLLIGVSVAMVFTLDAVQAAIEGAWPHQRRAAAMLPQERNARSIWALNAILLLTGGLLAIINLSVLLWQDLDYLDAHVLASILLATGWVVFLLLSVERFGVRTYIASIGPAAALAILAMLVMADLLFLLALADIWPGRETVEDALPLIIAARQL